MLVHRPTRLFCLLAFAYLLCALLVWLVPRVVPDQTLIGPSLDHPFAWATPGIFIVMLLMSRPHEIRLASGGAVDFFYSLFIFLLISVLVLGSLAFMLLRQSLYIEAVFKTLILMAATLLLIAWAWNPRPGFSGIGVFLSRYFLTVRLPFETWLQRLMESAENENDPGRFVYSACEGMLDLPWVMGGAWRHVNGVNAEAGSFGQKSSFQQDFPCQPLAFTLYTRQKLSPSLVWHFHLLLRLANEYYIAKQRARELQQMSYLRAVHETGARLTHDVKNLLQSLDNLCYMAQTPDDTDGVRLSRLLQRQLPQITQRLQQTLKKLQEPQAELDEAVGGIVSANAWWNALQQRYANDGVNFTRVDFDGTARLPSALFDSVVDNLLQNALVKRQSESGLAVRVTISADASLLCVCDSGSAVREEVANVLLSAPVPSENGLGIGLYHAARQAEAYGYQLQLENNVAGQVCFELRRINRDTSVQTR